MDENKYISIDKMQKESDEKFEKEVREHNAKVDAKRKARQDAENVEMQKLYKGMVDWSQYLRQILRDIQNRVYLPQLK